MVRWWRRRVVPVAIVAACLAMLGAATHASAQELVPHTARAESGTDAGLFRSPPIDPAALLTGVGRSAQFVLAARVASDDSGGRTPLPLATLGALAGVGLLAGVVLRGGSRCELTRIRLCSSGGVRAPPQRFFV